MEMLKRGFEKDEEGHAKIVVFRGIKLKAVPGVDEKELAKQLAALQAQMDALKG